MHPVIILPGMLSPDEENKESKIRHVFVLMLENRSFDHLLGYSGITGKIAGTGARGHPEGIFAPEPPANNTLEGKPIPASAGADFLMPEHNPDPGHELTDVLVQLTGLPLPKKPDFHHYPRVLNNGGFVRNYQEQHRPPADPGLIMKCFPPEKVPVLNYLARKFVVCDHWFSSVPGPTWPNRFFVHAATSGGLDHSPDLPEIIRSLARGYHFDHGTLFDLLGRHGRKWQIYRAGDFAMVHALRNIHSRDIRNYRDFARDLEQPDYPDYTFIEPDYGNFLTGNYRGGNSQHPLDDIRPGEELIHEVYRNIFQSSLGKSSLLIITYDEHGGFYDHVTPPGNAVPPGDSMKYSQWNFSFRQLGVRVPAVIISPYGESNLIDRTIYDHSSIPATVEKIFGLPPMTSRDKEANDLTGHFSLTTPVNMFDPGDPLPDPVPVILADDISSSPGTMGSVPDPDDPVDPMLAGFVHLAFKTSMENRGKNMDILTDDEISNELGSIHTRIDALRYIQQVKAGK